MSVSRETIEPEDEMLVTIKDKATFEPLAVIDNVTSVLSFSDIVMVYQPRVATVLNPNTAIIQVTE